MSALDSDRRPPFHDRRVVDLSVTVAGAYCARLLSDLGAEVCKVESPQGNPLRRRQRASSPQSNPPGALFRHLSGGHRSVVVDPDGPQARTQLTELLVEADAILWSAGTAFPDLSIDELRELAPAAVLCTLTDVGLSGPWADRPASELTLQAWCGGVAARGEPEAAPLQVGGEIGEWVTGMFAAVGVVTSWFAERHGCRGELIDVSKLEALAITITTMYPVTYAAVMERAYRDQRAINVPDVHKAKDGYVGFMCVTGQQLLDFFALVERPDWMDDASLLTFANRDARVASWWRRSIRGLPITRWKRSWTWQSCRVPAAPVGNGATIPTFPHLQTQGMIGTGAAGEFMEPVPSMWWSSFDPPQCPRPAPDLGAHSRKAWTEPPQPPIAVTPSTSRSLPFAGLRVVDFAAFWAGPIVGNYLAMLGADVIKVESATRLDGVRYQSRLTFDDPDWWEYAGLYQAANTNKRGVTIDMGTAAGRVVADDSSQRPTSWWRTSPRGCSMAGVLATNASASCERTLSCFACRRLAWTGRGEIWRATPRRWR